MLQQKANRLNDKGDIVNLYALLCSLATVGIAVYLTGILKRPFDAQAYKGIIISEDIPSCQPEPNETLAFVLAVIGFPIALVIFSALFNKHFSRIRITKKEYTVLTWFCVATVYVLIFSTVRVTFPNSMTVEKIPLYLLYAFAVYCLYTVAKSFSHRKAFAVIYFGIVIVFLLRFFLNIYTKDYMATGDDAVTHHFYAWWYPIYKVYSGGVIGVDFKNIYGFYPYIVYAALKSFGVPTPSKTAIIITAMNTFVAFSYFVFCYKFIRNKGLAFVCAFAASVYTCLSYFPNELYAQYSPTRRFFVSVVLFAVALVFRNQNKSFRMAIKIIMCPIVAMGIMWNFESGFVAGIIWSGYLILEKAVDHKFNDKKMIRAMLFSVGSMVLSIAMFIVVVEIFTYSKTHQTLSLQDIFFGILAFEGTGFYMMPLTYGAWIVAVLGYALALYRSVPRLALFNKENSVTPKSESYTATVGLFIAGITGIGCFSYFLGRSHPLNFVTAGYASFFVIGLLIEEYQRESKRSGSNPYLSGVKFMCGILILGMTLSACQGNVNTIVLHGDKQVVSSEDMERYNNITMAAKRFKKWEKELKVKKLPYLVYYSAYLNMLNEHKSTESIVELIDCFYVDNLRTYIETIEAKETQAFVISTKTIQYFENNIPDEWKESVEGYIVKDSFDNHEPGVGEQTYYLYVKQ